MSDPRPRMTSSLFSPGGSRPDETYISHLKIYEETSGEAGQKARYIIIATDSRGSALLHKSKENSNGSFSVGKTWKIEELRGFEVVAATRMRASFARTYDWQTSSAAEQTSFIRAAVGVYRQVTGSSNSLNLINCPKDFTTTVAAGVTPVNGSRAPSVGRSATTAGTARGYDIPAASPSRLGPAAPRSGISPVEHTRTVSRDASPRRAPSPMGNVPPVMPLRSSNGDASGSARPSPQIPSAQPSLYSPQAPRSSLPDRIVSPPPRRSSPLPRDTQSSFSTNFSDRTSAYPQSGISERMPSSIEEQYASSRVEEPPPRRQPSPQPQPQPQPRRQPSPQPPVVRSPPPPKSEPPPPAVIADTASATSSRTRTPRLPVTRPSLPRLETAKPEADARVEDFDPSNQAAADRLLSSQPNGTGSARDEDTVEATMSNVEEMLEGYEWASVMGHSTAGRSMGAADQIEARLTNELLALERANIHSFLETDDRIATVIKFIDESLSELNLMESQVTGYKIQLNAVSDDIGFIQGQNRGLQVQTQNQRLLLNELEKLLQTTHVDQDVLYALTQGSLNSGIEQLEYSAVQLYMALLSGRDNDMAAMIERLDEYRTHNSQFCKRLLDYLQIMFKAEATTVTRDNNKGMGRTSLALPPHLSMFRGLMKYANLIHYVKEMDEPKYAKIVEAYILESSALHGQEVKDLLMNCISRLKKTADDDEGSFSTAPATALRRAGTKVVRSPLDKKDKDPKQGGDGDMRVSDAFQTIIEQIAPQIRHEQDFLSDFLHINEAGVTFADVMHLDSYFRRQAVRSTDLLPLTQKIVRNAVDGIFHFLWAELRDWIDGALQRDNLQIVGIMAGLDRWINDVDSNDYFLSRMLQQKIQQRLRGMFQHQIGDQVKAIEQTRVTNKKRSGVAQFIKYFPIYVSRIEVQLVGADGYETRSMVDAAYEKLVQSMLECLKTMAKIDGDGEDKGQLNYHVILIENMFYFIHELSEQQLGAVRTFIRKAEDIYEENLSAYVKLVLRRPMGKLLDHFDGVERLLQTSGPQSVAASANYNKSAAKRVLKDYTSKDMRKNIEALFKRVTKHFAENDDAVVFQAGTVEMSVWKACEEDITKNTTRCAKLVTQCYADTGLGIEYSLADIEATFKKHRA